MKTCTYDGCVNEARHRETDDGAIDLCPPHHDEWVSRKDAMARGEENATRRFMGFWVRAQGGAKAAARRTGA